ncbi:nickel responsive regulator [Edwardsiella piscicida]|uniref:Nickel-responsive regulator n=3 Tax=Edwardsiella TaxID=635 RepID=A0A0H3DMG9_EDWTF|nr:nickel responsive regulator [Edwardsiella tarda EIB202]ADM40349.1 Nickel responsive regulator NikR [Edwardsiella tarda FL6-60]ARD18063.1 nickel-responsive transcriptional regulator NikR [Edwardsiella piscicida]QBB12155.1 nickel-responsive transcriptional regulator NikR [Edwardsiella piscicida]
MMQRVTLSLDDDLMAEIDAIMKARNYQNRSEAIRDLARAGLQSMTEAPSQSSHCVAALFYVYDHESRELSKRLTRTFHDHHDLSLASLHVHLDHGRCLEVSLLKGAGGEVTRFAEQVIAERGVRHGKLVVVPGDDGEAHAHPHLHAHD